MFVKKILVAGVLATAFATIVGCGKGKADAAAAAASDEALGQSADGLVGALVQSSPSHASKPSAVSCSGDQNGPGGRVCCDDTHCCVNANGKIDCSFGPRRAAK